MPLKIIKVDTRNVTRTGGKNTAPGFTMCLGFYTHLKVTCRERNREATRDDLFLEDSILLGSFMCSPKILTVSFHIFFPI